MRNLFGFYAISRQQGKAKSGAKDRFLESPLSAPALKDRSLDDKNNPSDG